ncbi:eukaryotictranslation initiation factor 3 subunit [Clonorchis sinensis]|uniref:Eukaryotictranslation initiation factor 3 subunit n=1 Tax=Clonorchis sinensis TaxID=79923 RepID=H2KRF9_CLOSI|nr:eukaryotictranslation initiation factor 3 subunit [Clonorchis sinensis]
MTTTINRVVRSEVHLKKLVQVLIKFITFELHPQWTYHALAWLKHLLLSPSSPRFPLSSSLLQACQPFLSYANEVYGLQDLYTQAALRGTVTEKWSEKIVMGHAVPQRFCYGGSVGIPSTCYIYVDDSDDESSERQARKSKRQKRKENEIGEVQLTSCHLNPEDSSGSEDTNTDDYMSEQEDSADDALDEANYDSDHGVFDVNETGSSDETSTHSSRNHIPDPEDWIGDPVDSSLLFRNRTSKADGHLKEEHSDEPPNETDKESEESDEELDLLMWTNQHANNADTSSSEAELGKPTNAKSKRSSNGTNPKSPRVAYSSKSSPLRTSRHSSKTNSLRTSKDTPTSPVFMKRLSKRRRKS